MAVNGYMEFLLSVLLHNEFRINFLNILRACPSNLPWLKDARYLSSCTITVTAAVTRTILSQMRGAFWKIAV
jgi:hypothetical protein